MIYTIKNIKYNSMEDYILSYLNYEELCAVRLINKNYKELVENVKVNDIKTIINDPILWNKNFPQAVGIKISNGWTDKDFKYLVINQNTLHNKRIYALDISNCTKITDNAFKYFTLNNTQKEELNILHMRNCNQLTDKTFEYLSCSYNLLRIYKLDISWCNRLTDKVFNYFNKIKYLRMSGCDQFTDNIFKSLKGIYILDISQCDQFTDNIFRYLTGIYAMNILGCKKIRKSINFSTQGIYTDDMMKCKEINNKMLLNYGISDKLQCDKEVYEKLPLKCKGIINIKKCKQIDNNIYCLKGIHSFYYSGNL